MLLQSSLHYRLLITSVYLLVHSSFVIIGHNIQCFVEQYIEQK